MNCKMCGNEIQENDQFCKHCGHSVTNEHTGKFNRCEKCGALMDPDDVYCLNCGEKREIYTKAEPVHQEAAAKKETSSTGKYIALAVFSIAAVILLFFGWNYYQYNSKLKQADMLFDSGEYVMAQDAYQSLADKNAKPEVLRKLKLSKSYSEAQSNYDNAMNHIQKGQYQQALQLLAGIPDDAAEIKTLANEEISKMEAPVIEFARSSIDDMDFESAESLLNAYIAQNPDNKEINKLKEEAKEAKKKSQTASQGSESTDQALSSGQSSAARKKAEREATAAQAQGVQDAAYSKDYLQGLIGLSTTVTSDKANLRSGPDINSSIVTYVSRGSSVYIYEVVPDGTERIWCHAIITSSVTGNTYDAWISSRNLDYSL